MNLRFLAISSLLGLGLAACSGDDSGTTGTTQTTQTTQTTNTTNPSTTSSSTSETGTTDPSGTDSDGMTTSGSSTTDPSTSGTTGDPTTGTTGDPTTGTTADPTTGTTGGGGDVWDPEGCMMPNQPLMVDMIEGAFCSAPCKMNSDCPEGPMGTNPQCALSTMGSMTPTNCALVCNLMDDQCPEGASCKDIMQMGLGVCTYP